MDAVIGRLLRINLSTGKIRIEKIPDDTFRKFLGGNGLAIKMFLEEVSPGIDAFSPDNILFLGTGPINGTGVQGSDRAYLAAKSPLTGLYFDSCMGGRFASSLKQAGFDAVAITGKAGRPSYVLIGPEDVEVCDASELNGKSPAEVKNILAKRLDNFEVCVIGIAGENLVRYASIIHPRHNARSGIAGRGGLGAVMGSKNLKAIALLRDKEVKVRINSAIGLKNIKSKIQTNLESKTGHLLSLGTAFGINAINTLGGLGTRNLNDEVFESASEVSGEQLRDVYYRKNISCHSCPVACGKLCELDGKLVKNPEYESIYALGCMMGIGDLAAIIRANILCDEYGLDTISMGITAAFAVECFEKGILSAEQTGNRTFRFGDANLLTSLIKETAYRNDIGQLLAEGTKHMSEIIGGDSWKYAYQVKGLELAGHSPRVIKTMAIGYATNTRGGSHQDARVRYGLDLDTYEGKVDMAIANQNLTAVGDSLVQCRFIMEAALGIDIGDEYSSLLEALTGWRPNTTELNEIGERIVNMERLFNVKEGIRRKDDTLPYRVMWEEIPRGAHKGERIPPEKLEDLLDNYYQLRGWDENGVPRRQTLERLGLEDYFAV